MRMLCRIYDIDYACGQKYHAMLMNKIFEWTIINDKTKLLCSEN